MQAIKRPAASNPVKNFMVPAPVEFESVCQVGDAPLASVDSAALSRRAGSLETNSNPVLRPGCTQGRLGPEPEQVNDLLRDRALDLSCNRWLQSGQLQGGNSWLDRWLSRRMSLSSAGDYRAWWRRPKLPMPASA